MMNMTSIYSKMYFSLMCLAAVILIGLTIFFVAYKSGQQPPKVRVIVDTDIGPWTDDVGSMAVLHSWADAGRIEIAAFMANNAYPGAASLIDALNGYFNRSKIPLGITKDPDAYASTGILGYPEWLLANSDQYPHPNYQNNSQAEDSVSLYRRILSSSPPKSITILSIGYLTNLAALLASPPDALSPLNGSELVRSKVKETLVMAGRFPEGLETNLKDQTSAAQSALHSWPTPVTYVGFEIGTGIRCGSNLLHPNGSSTIPKSPTSRVFEMYYAYKGRLDGCFDQTAAYVLVAGTERFFEQVKGQIEIFPNGSNRWQENGNQAYLRLKRGVDVATIKEEINKLQAR